MMVEKLLKFFVSVIDAQLFKSVEVENLETSNIQNTNKIVSWEGGGKSFVDVNTKPVEKTFENSLSESCFGVGNLGDGLTLGDEFGSDLNNNLYISIVKLHFLTFRFFIKSSSE
jgi:hypothetical protein